MNYEQESPGVPVIETKRYDQPRSLANKLLALTALVASLAGGLLAIKQIGNVGPKFDTGVGVGEIIEPADKPILVPVTESNETVTKVDLS